MADIGQEAALGVEQAFQAAEGLVEGVNELAHLIVRRALVGNAAREVVGAGDLQGGLGDVFQGSEGLVGAEPARQASD